MPTGVHTGKRVSDLKRQDIVRRLAAGESKASIQKRLHTSPHIVNIVLEEQWQDVAQRKEVLAAQAERNAVIAGEQIAEHLAKGKMPVNMLVPVYGVSMDKAIALRNDPQRIELNVTATMQGSSTLIERMNNLAQALNAKTPSGSPVLDAELSPTLTPSREAQEQVYHISKDSLLMLGAAAEKGTSSRAEAPTKD